MKSSFMQSLAAFACTAVISAHAVAAGDKRGIDWEEQLNLSEQQEEKIEAIESRYHTQLKALKKERHEQASALRHSMRNEIQQVLTKEQRQKARQLLSERRQHSTNKRLKRLSKKLDLSNEQKKQIRQKVREHQSQTQWPMDHQQRQQARLHFDQVMGEVLNDQQQQQWQAIKAKHAR